MLQSKTLWDAFFSLLIASGFTAAGYFIAMRLGADVSQATFYEVGGVLFNFACVWSTARQNPWAWVYGAIGTVLLGILFWKIALYSSMVMSLAYYFPIQFYGLWCWLKGGDDGMGAKVSFTTVKERVGMLAVAPLAIILWGMFMGTYTDAVYVYLDASVFGLSIIAQYMLTNKRVESWAFWGLINVMSVILYWKTGAYVLAVQYAMFFIHAIYGGTLWIMDYRRQIEDERNSEFA